MPLRRILASLILVSAASVCFLLAQSDEWQELKGSHFVVFSQSKESDFSDEVLRKAENHYSETIRYFGSLSGFWSWDNRCKIYLYSSRESYLFNTRQPEWSSGFADIKRRSIVSFENAPDFLDSVLPHEMAHLILREFIEAENKQVPRWLDEGFAISREENMRVALDETVRKAVRNNAAIPLYDLSKIGNLQSRPAEQAKLFYAQAQSVTRFLLESRDSSYFINFCRLLRDGMGLEVALLKSYREFSDFQDFEKKWKRYVLNS